MEGNLINFSVMEMFKYWIRFRELYFFLAITLNKLCFGERTVASYVTPCLWRPTLMIQSSCKEPLTKFDSIGMSASQLSFAVGQSKGQVVRVCVCVSGK
jgi:hypothetical protein